MFVYVLGALLLIVALLAAAYTFRARLFSRVLGLTPPRFGVRIEHVWVPMADGTELSTQVFFPKSGDNHPVLLMRTPYGQGLKGGLIGVVNNFYGRFFAGRGFIVVQQDVRGRFDSEGDFVPFLYERGDGQATLKWIRRQDWCDGRVGTFGHSYGGFVQWAICDDKGLSAVVPIQTSADLATAMHTDGAVQFELALRFLHILDIFGTPHAEGLLRAFRKQMRQTAEVMPATSALPIIDSDLTLLGREVHYFRDSLDAAKLDDPFWRHINHSTRRDRSTAPMFLVAGWMDPFLRESLRDHQALCDQGKNPRLLIGNWVHGQIHRHWLNEVLAFLQDHVRDGKPSRSHDIKYFLVGADRWLTTPSWPPPGDEQTVYLDGDALAFDVPRGPTEREYLYDPTDPTPHYAGPLLDLENCGQRDNRELEKRADILVYTSAPLTHDLDIVGPPQATLQVRASIPHVDYFVRLCLVNEKGESLNITDGFVRIGPDHPAVRGDVVDGEVTVELWPTAQRIHKGERIRLQVSSGAHPRYMRNLGYGDQEAYAERLRSAQHTVRAGPDAQSRLHLPLLRERASVKEPVRAPAEVDADLVPA